MKGSIQHVALTATIAIISLALAGCNLTGGDGQEESASQSATLTAQGLTNQQQEPTDTAPTPTSTPAPTTAIEHQVTPEEPAGTSGVLTDLSSSALAEEGRALADSFVANLLERPFTSETMEYQPHLDITQAQISKNGPFLYVTILLEGSPPPDGAAAYGIELDLDVDGRGDWLIMAPQPTNSTWTVEGVLACRDQDEDIGSSTPMRSDPPVQPSTGYEDCVFESGQGVSPDEAWVRLAPNDSSQVEIAFLHSLIEEDPQFLWGVWADAGQRAPGQFDYHDQFTIEEAGSAESSSDYYPLKELAQVDNSCRWTYGFSPSGSEPGICTLPATPVPTGQPDTCVKGESPGPGYYWDDERCQWRIIN